MSPDPLETLLDRLNDGDVAAAEQVFRARLRCCGGSCVGNCCRRCGPSSTRPTVQSVWTDLLDYFRKKGTRFVMPSTCGRSSSRRRGILHRLLPPESGGGTRTAAARPGDETLSAAGPDPGSPVLAERPLATALDLLSAGAP
jgi:hypothetical protein